MQFNTALTQALGLRLTATGSDAVVPGSTLQVGLKLEQKSGAPVEIEESAVTTSFGTRVATQLTPGGSQTVSVPVPASAPVTRPFFHRANLKQAYYDLSNPLLREAAVTPYPFVATTRLRYDGAPVELASVVGDGIPTMVVPALSVELEPEVALVPLGQKTLTLSATVRNDQTTVTGPVHGELKLELPAGMARGA